MLSLCSNTVNEDKADFSPRANTERVEKNKQFNGSVKVLNVCYLLGCIDDSQTVSVL